MRYESGRSLIEVLGVLAITGVMAVASIGVYNMIRNNQTHTIAATELEQLTRDIKLLMDARGTYEGLSVPYLVKAGALKSEHAPIGDDTWSVTASSDGTSFMINLTNLRHSDCAYFSAAVPKWATRVIVNGFDSDASSGDCFSTSTNMVSFVIE